MVDVGVVDGMSYATFVSNPARGAVDGIQDQVTAIEGYPALLYRHAQGPRSCGELIDIHDDQMLWVTFMNLDEQMSGGDAMADVCTETRAMATAALAVARKR